MTSKPAPGAVRRVILLGPDDEARRTLHLLVSRCGFEVVAASEVEAVRKHLATTQCDVVLATLDLATALCTDTSATPPVIAVLRERNASAAVGVLQAGAVDVLLEPLDELAITLALRKIEVAAPRTKADGPNGGHGHAIPAPDMIGDGVAMQKLKSTIRLVAPQRTTVLILGESGTGKELVARAIHAQSPRRANKFVAINCAALPGALLESELFGHVRGAFTDAVRDKLGLFEEADGGTLFLDEVGELPQPLQSKLLRALQESEIRRVGDSASIKIDVRLIAATLRDLTDDVAAGRFREDLYYRLAVLPVPVPPLRERPDDIPQLARFFVQRHAARHHRTVELTPATLDALSRQAWPGNVRELENAIERALVLAEGPVIDVDFLATIIQLKTASIGTDPTELSIKKATRSLEQELIRRALGVTGGNRTNAAKLLEISHRALLYKMKEYGIS